MTPDGTGTYCDYFKGVKVDKATGNLTGQLDAKTYCGLSKAPAAGLVGKVKPVGEAAVLVSDYNQAYGETGIPVAYVVLLATGTYELKLTDGSMVVAGSWTGTAPTASLAGGMKRSMAR